MFKKLNLGLLAVVSVATVVIGFLLKRQFGTDWWELAGFTTGVIAVYLVAVEHITNWPVGLVNVAIYAWVFYNGRLLADMSLQFFFFALNVQGWIQWARGGTGKSELAISRVALKSWIYIVAIWVAGTAVYYPIIVHFNGAAPLVDSALTVASIIAQFQLNFKKLENWIIWIAVDAVYIRLYITRDLVATAVLYGLFLALAISGLIGWLKTHRQLAAASVIPNSV